MKLNVIIADDEFFIRQRLIKLIPWESLDLHLIGEAENGLEVLDLLSTHDVDLVILDIQMPKMTGIEVAQYIHTHYAHTRILILSGYNDFEYARQTLRYNALDYLLKPIDSATLSQALSSCCTNILASKQNTLAMKRYAHFERQSKLNQVLHGIEPVHTLHNHYPVLKSATAASYIGCYLQENGSDLMEELKNMFVAEGIFCEYFQESEHLYILQAFFQQTSDYFKLEGAINQFINQHTTYIFGFIGKLFFIERPWISYYKETLEGLSMRYFHPNVAVLMHTEPLTATTPHKALSKIRQKLTTLINSKDRTGLIAYFDSCFAQIAHQSDVHYLQTAIYEVLLTFKIYYAEFVELANNLQQYTQELLEEHYQLEQLKTLLISYGLQCLSGTNTLPSDIIVSQKIIQYIDTHYQDVDLSVAKISTIFGFNTSYLGTIFKKATNQSILQYITNLRLEASKHLLELQQYKISEVAEKVGYADVFYYSKRFKKAYGCSPKDYGAKLALPHPDIPTTDALPK